MASWLSSFWQGTGTGVYAEQKHRVQVSICMYEIVDPYPSVVFCINAKLAPQQVLQFGFGSIVSRTVRSASRLVLRCLPDVNLHLADQVFG
ncbi:hypothetical protein M404DRAFT_516215 [Pisolithus tinctorius Marx 270]|uniref:Uncharacterized protein n=1 Tax=Pisolithus tinctorius Marx 270 TaxID=870435 RepID=A0A0C3NCN6_PISTI|nr:hypothetical protein M404DRAFT_516215 [Pisolithus tinctorius Marx 270]